MGFLKRMLAWRPLTRRIKGLEGTVEDPVSNDTRRNGRTKPEDLILKNDFKENYRRKEFEGYLKDSYKNMSENKRNLLNKAINSAYEKLDGEKSRREILKDEIRYSSELNNFIQYTKSNPEDYIGKAILDETKRKFKQLKGEKSHARIFNELRSEGIKTGFRYNEKLNRYETYVKFGSEKLANDSSVDIRNLMRTMDIQKTRKNELEASRDPMELSFMNQYEKEREKYALKRNILSDLGSQTNEETKRLRNLGINIDYQGFAKNIREKYNQKVEAPQLTYA